MFAVPLSENAELRPLEPWQASEYLEHIERGRAHIDAWINWAGLATDLDSARTVLQNYADRQAADTARLYGIWLDGTLVGGVMFVRFDAKGGTCEIGVWTEPAAQGRGLVSSAVRHLIDYAFTVRGMHRIEWHNRPDNLRSRAVAQRMGFTLEGVLRESYLHAGVHQDGEVWSLLTHEWKPQGTPTA
ncbi:GNAT family N-acetyltransferase [Kitasatospora sp. MBT66]|uniref:GNAT family N-acetyltransferase n=1 Tax=Kitasatospora sp. MBT66 TaxID=1444769 RepID=UPI0005B8A175|nr:GNAT family protein [Kitasatospora sp. MBT66]